VELQEPGPVYLLMSAGGWAARAGIGPTATNAPSENTAHSHAGRLAFAPIFIQLLE
jgi:hypothetical protein